MCHDSLLSVAACLVQEAKLIDAKSRNNMYFIEYTVKKPSQEEKHLLSAIALGFNGRQVDSAKCVLKSSVPGVLKMCIIIAGDMDCKHDAHLLSMLKQAVLCVTEHLHST